MDLEEAPLLSEEELVPVPVAIAVEGVLLLANMNGQQLDVIPAAQPDVEAAVAEGGLNFDLLTQQGIEINPGPSDGPSDHARAERRAELERERCLVASNDLLDRAAILRSPGLLLRSVTATRSVARLTADVIKELCCACDVCYQAKRYSVGESFPDVKDFVYARASELHKRAFNWATWRQLVQPVELPVATSLPEARYWVEHGLLLGEAGYNMNTNNKSMHRLRQ
jgi:hypothetical protein